jgi:hypothetical protein
MALAPLYGTAGEALSKEPYRYVVGGHGHQRQSHETPDLHRIQSVIDGLYQDAPDDMDTPKALGIPQLLTPMMRQGRLMFIEAARQLGLSANACVTLRSMIANVEASDLRMCDMGLLTWNIDALDKGEWSPCRVEWFTTPTTYSYHHPGHLAVVED